MKEAVAKLRALFAEKGERLAARRLVDAVARQARRAEFYGNGAVADTLDGRFDLTALHAWIVLSALKAEPRGRTAQALTDLLFRQFDDALREMGVGDLSVARKMKGFASAFYGRLGAYDAAVAKGPAEGAAAIEEALARNLYRDAPVAPAILAAMAAYVAAARAGLEREGLDALLAGTASFPPPPAIAPEAAP
ncbi:MAG: ubiquinol-cytochrome C chaperone family protein [Alphaproteobacteria bacterium]|nr:ubiquinol-cytochrome C chaperone family protein [Alphaproteobacteria bacterium]